MSDVIHIPPKKGEILDSSEYCEDLTGYFNSMPDVARPLVVSAKEGFAKIEQMLYSAPAFINYVKANIPEHTLQAVLTDEQKKEIASGALKLMTKKDGSLMANLVNPETNKIVSTIPLKDVKLTPDITQVMTNYATQMQMAEIAEQIKEVQYAIEEVRQGQEYDRLATAYSCQQKLLQAMQMENTELKSMALLQIASDAEDSRNLLMQSQSSNLNYLKGQPKTFLGKMMKGDPQETVDQRMNEVRESLNAINMDSLVEAMAYQELGEPLAARQSLQYYAGYIDKAYLSSEGFVERLDLMDRSPKNYWSKTLPDIKKKIQALPCYENVALLEDKEDESEQNVQE